MSMTVGNLSIKYYPKSLPFVTDSYGVGQECGIFRQRNYQVIPLQQMPQRFLVALYDPPPKDQIIILRTMLTTNLGFLGNLLLTAGYCTLHLVLSKYFSLNSNGIAIHAILAVVLAAQCLTEADVSANINSGAFLPLLTLIWFTLFGLVDFFLKVHKLSPDVESDIKIRCVAIFHGGVSSLLSWYLLIAGSLRGAFEMENMGIEELKFVKLTEFFSLSYFIYHSFLSLQSKYRGKSMVEHHLLTIACISYFSYYGYHYYALAGAAVGQITNPLMHIKAILNKLGFAHTRSSVLVEKVYIYCYIFMRTVVFVSAVFLPSILDDKADHMVKLLLFGFLSFNLHIVSQMLRVVQSRQQKEREMREKKIQYQWFAKDEDELRQLSFYKQDTKDQ